MISSADITAIAKECLISHQTGKDFTITARLTLKPKTKRIIRKFILQARTAKNMITDNAL